LPSDRSRRFGGIARLYGPAALERFATARVCVVGVGGVGSWAVEALARSGIGHLVLIDLDHIAESNVNRQIQALEPDLGKAKVQALAARIAAIDPDAQVTPVEVFAEPDNLAQIIDPTWDALLDCIDGYRSKAALIAHCRRIGLYLASAGGAGGRRDPMRVRIADLSRTEHDPLLSKTRKLLRSQYGFPRDPKRRFAVPCVYSAEQPPTPARVAGCDPARSAAPGSGLHCGGHGSVVTVTAGFGLAAASLVLAHLAQAPSPAPVGALT
jgi:tRNA threonylcarbamoyladenosine dehydratase